MCVESELLLMVTTFRSSVVRSSLDDFGELVKTEERQCENGQLELLSCRVLVCACQCCVFVQLLPSLAVSFLYKNGMSEGLEGEKNQKRRKNVVLLF